MDRLTEDEKKLRKAQYEMHKNFFDRAKEAIEHGFYLEAIFLEYAAIEGRLEIILGVLGCPCNKDLPDAERKNMKISHRITCLKKLMKKMPFFEKSKLDSQFFKDFGEWITNRNRYVHGLYKNGTEYVNRKQNAEQIAMEGLEIARKLYDEANRLKQLLKKSGSYHLEYGGCLCFAKKCQKNLEREENHE